MSLGFIYQRVYSDSFSYKLGKVVIAQEALMIRSVQTSSTHSTPAISTTPVVTACDPPVSPKAENPIAPPKSPNPESAEGDEFVMVEDDADDDIIALD